MRVDLNNLNLGIIGFVNTVLTNWERDYFIKSTEVRV